MLCTYLNSKHLYTICLIICCMKELTQELFEKEINQGIFVIDFWASWCGPCRAMAPVFESISEQMPKVKFAKVNVEECQQIARKYEISSIPCFIIFKNGKEVGRIVGGMDEESFIEKINEFI